MSVESETPFGRFAGRHLKEIIVADNTDTAWNGILSEFLNTDCYAIHVVVYLPARKRSPCKYLCLRCALRPLGLPHNCGPCRLCMDAAPPLQDAAWAIATSHCRKHIPSARRETLVLFRGVEQKV